jgi:hypothetical protein
MSGFMQNARGMGLGMPQNVMSGFVPNTIPMYAALAGEFDIFDRWFAFVPTSMQPNHLFIHSATSHGLTFNARKDLINGFPQKTIAGGARGFSSSYPRPRNVHDVGLSGFHGKAQLFHLTLMLTCGRPLNEYMWAWTTVSWVARFHLQP